MDSADAADGKRRTQAWMGPPIQPPAPTRSLRWVPNPAPGSAPLPAYPSQPGSSVVNERAPGSVVGGRYRLVRALGQGTLTETWEATHVELDRGVAIKFVRQIEAGVAERMVEEARAIARIRHPHVLEFSDFGRSEQGEPYFVMELLAGQTVEQLLARRRVIPWARAVAIVQQVGEALGAAHQHGVVHRDLRPGNVFLVDTGQATDFVKVMDFGLARASVLGGTPSYMSPEQCRGEPLDPRSDVYALGCLLFAMITGDPPFVGEAERVIRKQLEEAPKSLRERAPRQFIPDELEAILARCLAKQPSERFADTRELAAGLATLAKFTANASAGAGQDASASGSRPMGYAGRPPPKSPRELTDSYRPVNQPIVDDAPEQPAAKADSSAKKVPANAGVSVSAVIALTVAGVLAIGGVGLGMYWLVNRLIGEHDDAEVRAAPESGDRAAAEPSESVESPKPAPAPPPVVQPKPVAVEEASAKVEPVAPAAEEAAKPAARKSSKGSSHGEQAPADEAVSPEPPPSAPEPEPEKKKHKPSVEPDSKAKDKIGHDDLLDPWG